MRKKISLDALEVKSFRTSQPRELFGGNAFLAGTVYYTCMEGCTHGPDCDTGGGPATTLECTE